MALAVALALSAVPAAGDRIRTDPTIPGGLLIRVPHTIATLPRVLEGFRLGDRLSEITTRLRRGGWTVRQYHRRRRGLSYTRVHARLLRRGYRLHRSRVYLGGRSRRSFRRRWGHRRLSRQGRRPGHLRRLKMNFSGGRLVTVRVYYWPSGRKRALALASICTGRERASPGRQHFNCLDPQRTTTWRIHKGGARAELIDLAALLRAGFVTRFDVESRVRRAALSSAPGVR